MRKRALVLALSGVLLAAAPTQHALAQSCADQIARLAQQYGLSVDAPLSGDTGAPATSLAPPATAESRGLTETQRTAQSPGMVTPPDAGAPVATVPPSGASAPPAVPPTARTGTAEETLGAAERQRIESLLAAARAADRRGDDLECRDEVRAAAAVPGVPGARRPQ